MNSHHIKSVNTDERSTKRLTFASSRKRSKLTSADTYRTFQGRRVGIGTSAATREEQVHNPRPKKKQRQRKSKEQKEAEDKAILSDQDDSDSDVETNKSNFASELDIALDRNASIVFGSFHREVWHLVRSLPEIIHHADKIIHLLMAYMLSPATDPETKSNIGETDLLADSKRARYVVNYATIDILHLVAVLARDLRHEIHPFMHQTIIPRILNDLLHPPAHENNKQQMPLDVCFVEAAFRTVSYLFRYDAEALLAEKAGGEEPCLEPIREYYGLVLASRRDVVRRLGAETFAPLVRKLSESARKRHLKRLLKALARNSAGDSSAARRLQSDAIDGISTFLFEVARGVQRRLHSKGIVVIKAVEEAVSCQDELNGGYELLINVGEAFVNRLTRSLDAQNIAAVFRVMCKPVKTVISSEGRLVGQGFVGVLRLIGKLCSRHESLLETVELLDQLLYVSIFDQLSLKQQESVLDLLSLVWKRAPEQKEFTGRMNSRICNLIKTCIGVGSKDTNENAGAHALSVALDLMAYLPVEVAMKTVGSALLSVAAASDFEVGDSTLPLLFAVVGARDRAIDVGGTDALFDLHLARHCLVNETDREKLLHNLLLLTGGDDWTTEKVASAGIAVQCLAFIAATTADERRATMMFEQVAKGIVAVMKVTASSTAINDIDAKRKVSLTFSLALESLSCLAAFQLEGVTKDKLVQKVVEEVMPLARDHLVASPSALWTVKSVAAYVHVLQQLHLRLNVDFERAFDDLIPNLRSRKHFFRLHTLEILSSFPLRTMAVDYADLDLAGDLDDEPRDGQRIPKANVSLAAISTFGMLSLLLAIESCPVSFEHERQLISQISRVSVLGRGRRLPIYYAEAAANHLVGLLHVKFAPVWPAIVQAIGELAKGHVKCTWPPIFKSIQSLMERPLRQSSPDEDLSCEATTLCNVNNYCSKCLSWETADVHAHSLFKRDFASCHVAGIVSKHDAVDEATVLEWLWKIIENGPELLTQHASVIVPCILRFIQEQYFAGSRVDPDARELKIYDLVACGRGWEGLAVDKGAVYRRLVSVLRALASVKNVSHLQSHGMSDTIYKSLLTHPDNLVGRLALTCLLRYKFDYLSGYEHGLLKLFEKDQLRDSLLQMKSIAEEDSNFSHHRGNVIPILSRILFGRLSARPAGKSSKQSPCTMRHAVLSFLTSFCVDDNELYPFVYLCLRAYVPLNVEVKILEAQDATRRDEIIGALVCGTAESFAHVSSSVHQGFLHMLEALIAQLGHRVSHFVPAFMTILVALVKRFELRTPDENFTVALQTTDDSRDGLIRTLCFRRFSEIFAKFNSTIDFREYQARLWDALGNSINQLPISAVNSTQVPAVLQLLKTISVYPRLFYLIKSNDAAITSVVRCIGERSGASVVEAALAFIDNILVHCTDDDSGSALVRPHVPLILNQFQSRLKHFDAGVTPWALKQATVNNASEASTWRQELAILCRISALVGNSISRLTAEDDNAALSDLLVPFLESGRLTENDLLNTLGILQALSPKLGTEAALRLFNRISILLGPEKKKPRNLAKQIYRAMASVLSILSSSSLHFAVTSTDITLSLWSLHSVRIDELDIDKVVATLGRLGETSGFLWIKLSRSSEAIDPVALQPVITTCFRFLFDDDGVVSRGAFKALKALVFAAGREAQSSNESATLWLKCLEGTIAAFIRNGITIKDESIRRFYILLLAEVCRMAQSAGFDSPHLHSDLAKLIRDDAPDLDFFLNITHVQIHRRARALQRLRQNLATSSNATETFFSQTISSILIPVATHAVYESKTKTEENLATEAIATVGALCRLLTWSKYSTLLGTTINQFHRHVEQERFLVALICSILDGFHFQVALGNGSDGVVWRALEKRFIPKLEGLLVKEKTDRKGETIKTLRPPIVLAMLKLFQQFPRMYLIGKLPRLLTVICGMLKNRDSNVRDLARTTLAHMTVSLDITFLADIIRELAVTLKEGYQLHVRAATIHSILLELSLSYTVPDLGVNEEAEIGFDNAVPGMIDLIQQDIFGDAQERKDAEGNQVRYVKEAAGSKSYHSLEIISSLILFKPSTGEKSTVHVIVIPFLERLKNPTISAGLIRRIKECLTRIVTGLSRNSSLGSDEALAFVHATIEPFIRRHSVEAVTSSLYLIAGLESDDDACTPLHVSGSLPNATMVHSCSRQLSVAEWRPSVSGFSSTANEARLAKRLSERNLATVQDGCSAPTLTGANRHLRLVDSSALSINNPASVSAVLFGLQLLHSAVKQVRSEQVDLVKLDVFVPILTACVCTCSDLEVVFLALKTLCLLLSFDLPSFEVYATSLSSKAVELLTSSGSARNQNNETAHSCYKMLAYLLDFERKRGLDGSDAATTSHQLLDNAQMELLLSFVRASIVDSDNYNPAFRLLKAIMSRRFASSEFYDLMETLLQQTAKSHKPSLREQSTTTFINFLLTYPMSTERIEQHLKQAVLNIKYEYADGRLSAIQLLSTVIKRLPLELLDHHLQLFFLPLTLQLANDLSEECRNAVASCIRSLLGRLLKIAATLL
ncbi:hypothetical protein MPSEU_000429800 [Mayamaea pseudoterrestris]|nr:hypothetical protein MPSEU_000429800 [Mayamaea pseudoterrestris]